MSTVVPSGAWRSMDLNREIDPSDESESRVLWINYSDGRELGVLTHLIGGDFTEQLRAYNPNISDPRWLCPSWQSEMLKIAESIKHAAGAALGMIGTPMICAPRNSESDYGHALWACRGRNGVMAMIYGPKACGECIGCLATTNATTRAPRGKPSVYFAQSVAGGPVKIGHSNDPEARVASLQTAHADTLRIIGTIPGGRAVETALHASFADDRIGGEWFRPSPSLVAFMREIRRGA